MRRTDLRGRRAPRWLQDLLTRRYGRTPFGEPRFRLVWAPSRFEPSGGEWVDGPPLRRVVQLRWVPRYPGEQAWLIERWVPAWSYGTPEQWYRPVAEGGTLLPCGIAACGDYPQFGDYEDIGARMHWYPTERHVTAAVDAVEWSRNEGPSSPLGRARRRTHLAGEAQARRDREFEQLADDVFDDCAPAFHGAPMVGYGGSHRPALVEMAERAGIRQHPL